MHKKNDIGVVGFGVMGASMARNLARAGYCVYGYSRTPDKVIALADEGIRATSSPRELGTRCDTILLSVTDGAAVESTLFGPDGLVESLAPGSLIIDTTTIAPSEARDLATRCSERGIGFIDAPVSGGDVGARNGTLTIMCGGEASDVARAMPVLEKIGKKIVHVGPSGSGQLTKAVNQVAVALGIVAMTEALHVAETLGLDVPTTLDILQGGAADSWALRNYAPRLLSGDFAPGFDAAHMLKDLRIAREMWGDDKARLPGLETTITLFEELVERHKGVGNHALMKRY
jgi:3-hydroxyisobutyrate dehydrogenase